MFIQQNICSYYKWYYGKIFIVVEVYLLYFNEKSKVYKRIYMMYDLVFFKNEYK